MIDHERILRPLPGANPAGVSIRHSHILADLQRELRHDPPGVENGKKCNPTAAIKLASRILETESKDLAVVIHLTEALTRQYGFRGLAAGLRMSRDLMERFWETMYPEIDPDDEGYRAAPLQSIRGALFEAVCAIPITAGGYSYFHYSDSRDRAEEDAAELEKVRVRGLAVRADFDRDEALTPREFYEQLVSDVAEAQAAVSEFATFCGQRFQEETSLPSLVAMERTLREYASHAAAILARRPTKNVTAPSAVLEVEDSRAELESTPEPSASEGAEEEPETHSESEPPSQPQEPLTVASAWNWDELTDEQADEILSKLSGHYRRQQQTDPTGYLLVVAHRYARGLASASDADYLPPPSTDQRIRLRQLHQQENWQDLLDEAILVMASPEGRHWLDLPYYIDDACSHLGNDYDQIRDGVRALVTYYLSFELELPTREMLDGMPTASPATASWLEQLNSGGTPARPPFGVPGIPYDTDDPAEPERDPMREALSIAARGRLAEALEILRAEPAWGGRAEFEQRFKFAQLAVQARQPEMALIFLRQLREKMSQFPLEQWEPEMAANAWQLLYQLARDAGTSTEEEAEALAKLCALNPVAGVRQNQKA